MEVQRGTKWRERIGKVRHFTIKSAALLKIGCHKTLLYEALPTLHQNTPSTLAKEKECNRIRKNARPQLACVRLVMTGQCRTVTFLGIFNWEEQNCIQLNIKREKNTWDSAQRCNSGSETQMTQSGDRTDPDGFDSSGGVKKMRRTPTWFSHVSPQLKLRAPLPPLALSSPSALFPLRQNNTAVRSPQTTQSAAPLQEVVPQGGTGRRGALGGDKHTDSGHSQGSLPMNCGPGLCWDGGGFGVPTSLFLAILVLALANSSLRVWGISGSNRTPWAEEKARWFAFFFSR